MNTGQFAPKDFLETEARGVLTQGREDTDWTEAKNRSGSRLEGAIEKRQAEK